jgi:hypothetical protein
VDEDVFILRGKVQRSQAVNNTPHSAWAAVKRCGIVINGHCICMAGLSETCSHVASILFKTWMLRDAIETSQSSETACTSVACKWIVPQGIAEVGPKCKYRK